MGMAGLPALGLSRHRWWALGPLSLGSQSPFAKMWMPIFEEMDRRDTFLVLHERLQGSSLGYSRSHRWGS